MTTDSLPTDHPLLHDLNPPQREAVTTTEGPVLVIAGAGSGKTRVVTHRIAYLIAATGVAPWQILAATFTNKAAREMKARVARLCPAADTVRLALATFHSHCARILRDEAAAAGLTPRYTICDETDQTALVRDCIRQLGHDPKAMTPGPAIEVISLAKMRLLEGEEAAAFIEDLRGPDYAAVYNLYEKRLREGDAVDFDDLLLRVVRLWQTHAEILQIYRRRYQYVLVDEYQDTNLAQFELVRLLTAEHRNICVVGDEDQSIYSWRGAEIGNLLDFQKHFPEANLIRLEQNYRSTGNILAAAGAVIARNSQRLGKTLWTGAPAGDPAVEMEAATDRREAIWMAQEIRRLNNEGLPFEEMAVFYRINALSRIYEDALREEDIPYRVIGGVRFYDRAEIRDLLSYLQVIDNPGATLALLRIVNRPKRGIGDAAVSRLLACAEEQKIPLFQVLVDSDRIGAAGLKGKAAEGARELGRSFLKWIAAAPKAPLKKLVQRILKETDYEASLGDSRSLEVLSRLENVREFVGSLGQFHEQRPDATLHDYLEAIALRAVENEEDKARGVSLMSMHNAKGLEFDAVFLPALEKDIFPNPRAVRDQGHPEEERRLFYVCLTRARKRLYLSHAVVRQLYGQQNYTTPSIFLYEIPDKLRVRWEEADLAPLAPSAKAPPAERPAAKAPAAARRRRFVHDLLGEIEILSEERAGGERRLVVRDASGAQHVLLASHARLKPAPGDSTRSSDAPAGGVPADSDEEMPF